MCHSITSASASTTINDLHGRVFQCGLRGVAEPEAADDDVEIAARQRRQSNPRQRDLGDGEQARHQELVAELDLVDVEARGELPSSAQAEHAHRRRAEIQLLEIDAHRRPPLTTTQNRGANDGGPAAPHRTKPIPARLPRPGLN